MTAQPLPYQWHSGTSKAGAAEARERAASQEARVLEFLREHGSMGATDEEITMGLADGMTKESSWRRSRILLMERGLVSFHRIPLKVPHIHTESRSYCSGCIETRKSTSGVRCAVWFAKGKMK